MISTFILIHWLWLIYSLSVCVWGSGLAFVAVHACLAVWVCSHLDPLYVLPVWPLGSHWLRSRACQGWCQECYTYLFVCDVIYLVCLSS